MAIQTATLGDLEHAQNIIVAQCRYTAEHNAVAANLIERFTLGKGQKSMTIPKVAQATAQSLTDGVDLVDTQDIGLTYTELTTSEVGLKFILTDKLVRQFNEDVMRVVGRQMGDAMARKVDTDVIALFSSLNGGTTLGKDGINLTMYNAMSCVSRATSGKYPTPVSVLHHPNAIAILGKSASAVGAVGASASTYFHGILQGLSEELLRNFWAMRINGVNFFQDGNVPKVSGVDSGYGAIFSKSSMCKIESLAPTTERERDASLRAWEVVMVSDYGCFEIDDNYGAPMLYEIGDLTTTTT